MARVPSSSSGISKTRKRVKQARNRRLFMDEDDFEQSEKQETLREIEDGHDAVDIFLDADFDDGVERQV